MNVMDTAFDEGVRLSCHDLANTILLLTVCVTTTTTDYICNCCCRLVYQVYGMFCVTATKWSQDAHAKWLRSPPNRKWPSLLSGVCGPRLLGRDHEEAKVHRIFIGLGGHIPPRRVQS